MAQGDLFQNLINQTKGYGITTEDLNDAVQRLYESKMNIVRVNEKLKKSDLDTLNIAKRALNVGGKIIDQIKDNKKMSEDILKSRKELNKLEETITKTQDDSLKKALISLRNKKRLEYDVANIQMEHMRKSIPLLGLIGKRSAFISDAIGGFTDLFSGNSMVVNVISSIIGGLFKIGTTIFKMFLSPLRKAFSVFLEMQNTVGNLAADIGLTAIESRNLLNNFTSLTLSAMKFGGSMKDVATIIQGFSENTNKNRLFNEREIEQLVELGLGTGLGIQGATELASSFDNIGLSLEKTVKLTDKARNLSAKMNINTAKVLKTYQGLVQSLTGIGFGRGLENLTKLAAKATSIRFDIAKSTESFKDAFFEPEKAVEAAARMQVLGGRFAQNFGDPMQLAFESMNSPEKLAERVTEVLKGSIVKSGGQFIIPPQERQMLKIMAEQLGQDYSELVGTAIEQAKIMDKMSALTKSGANLLGFKEEDKIGLANLMTLNKDNKYEIRMSDGTTKLLENITDRNQLKSILDSRKKNEDAAIQRKNLIERLSLIADRFMLGFSSVFTKLFGSTDFESFLQMVENSGTKIATFINDKILGSDGLAETFKSIIDKGKEIFDKISNIFNSESGIGSKIKSSLGVLFSDLLKPILNVLFPYLKAGWGALLSSMRDIPLIGSGLGKVGDRLQREALAADSTKGLKSIYGTNTLQEIESKNNYGLPAAASLAKNTGMMLAGNKLGFGSLVNEAGSKMFNKFAPNLATKGLGNFGLKAATLGTAGKIPVAGDILRILLGVGYDGLYKGDWKEAGLQSGIGLASGIANVFAPGSGTLASTAIDATRMANDMGAFNDGVIYKDGSYAKFSKGDMVQFIDQAAMERAAMNNSTNNTSNTIQHSGVITIKSDDGKVITWDQMYAFRDLLGSKIASINDSYNNGFGNLQNPNMSPIKPLI